MLFLAFLSCALADLACTVDQYSGCYVDSGDNRLLSSVASMNDGHLTQEACATMCARFNYSLAGVEFGVQCFCADKFAYAPEKKPTVECSTMKCPGEKTEACGVADRILVYTYKCTGAVTPSAHGCLTPASKVFPFCNASLPVEKRLDDLFARLTLEEKMAMIGNDKNTGVDACSCMTGGVPRLDIPPHMQIVETNTAVASACLRENQCATVFPGPTGIAASFNRTLWRAKGHVISEEMRALNNFGWHRGMGSQFKIGLLGYGPNINIVRDPRFGRNSELPSEDPLVSGTYATEYVKGCQEGSDPKYLKMISGLKHYALYTVETDRAGFVPTVNTFDLWDTYMPQYAMAFSKDHGNAQAAMCSYAGRNGVPSCASDFLLNQIVRKKFGRPDVLIGTDCGAISELVSPKKYSRNNSQAAADAINGGTDVNMGGTFFSPAANGGNGALLDAIHHGLTDEAHVTQAARRHLEKRFRAGQFDPLDQQPFTKIPISVVNSSAHQDINYEAAIQGLVLLKNDKNTLPFPLGSKRLAVVGPHVDSTHDLMSDYAGDQSCVDGTYDCVPTFRTVFTNMNGPSLTTVVPGVDMDSKSTEHIKEAVDAVRAADIAVLCIGIARAQEHEGIDRTQLGLPGMQEEFAKQIIALGKPTVIVLVNGGAVAIDDLIAPAPAIIEAFYPSLRGAEAVARAVFGRDNRWGKLPVTIYPLAFQDEQALTDFDMTKAPGRTYRYYQKQPLFPFGFGLSYTTFAYACSGSSASNTTKINCMVTNDGERDGDNVLIAYHRAGADVRGKVHHPVPIRSVVDFDRVFVKTNEKESVSFDIPWNALVLTDMNGDKILYAGTHFIDVSDGVGKTFSYEVTVPTTTTVDTSPRE